MKKHQKRNGRKELQLQQLHEEEEAEADDQADNQMIK